MALSAEQKQRIKDSTLLYRSHIQKINDWIYNEPDDERCELFYLLRALCTIEHGERIDLYNEKLTETQLEEIAKEVKIHFPDKDDAELYDDLAILEDPIRERYFANPVSEKNSLLKQLSLEL